MNSYEIRNAFLQFFESKQHKIVPSAPLVVKNDPTLMFTNAGMNQFKDIFLGNEPAKYKRIADSQKCLRVSGKHNDLEEVGHDTYHHTMFEMLGNWSFGDYFKAEAIDWAWEFLTEVLKIDKEKLYVTVFEGSPEESIEMDKEAFEMWKKHVPEERILLGNKKDNFWEMGESGPCGPCSEIHIDLRPEEDIKKIPGRELVNASHPLVIEIWNNVFIQFNRKVSGELEQLPAKHVDTGMGFERLCRVIQKKDSNYDIDLFQIIIREIELVTNKTYGKAEQTDIAMRVIADHLRAISFAIADGQIPSNNKAGYVIRRLLRRAVRYGFTFLDMRQPFIFSLVPALIRAMGESYPELKSQQNLIERVMKEEEASFLRTLETGIRLIEQIMQKVKAAKSTVVNGKDAFELYDTFGFPLDLTELILRENGLTLDKAGFDAEMEAQKNRSRQAAAVDTQDWVNISSAEKTEFVGYDYTECEVSIARFRKVTTKGKTLYHIVFDKTPFYGESGGQMGDKGWLESANDRVEIIDTIKENNLFIHIAESLPEKLEGKFTARVDKEKRQQTQNNHSATHLLHKALRDTLGTHVEQKGSLVGPDYLRFDFSHFQKMSPEEIQKVEHHVNEKIRESIALNETRNCPIEDAKKLGAMMLFGEKYGESVRVIKFGDSIELCGGTHVKSTGNIGFFKIISEGAIAAGIRRIEAITGDKVEEYLYQKEGSLKTIGELLKNQPDVVKGVENLVHENTTLRKQLETLLREKNSQMAGQLIKNIQKTGNINVIAEKITIDSVQSMKDLAFQIKPQVENLVMVLAAEIDGKVSLAVMVSDNLTKELNAGNIIREIAKEVDGGGGGQPFFATAGGKNPKGIDNALKKAREIVAAKA
ncbi:MAG TPA: alanine--tRNA ligase [Bacteroidales bacterium]|nr:alanine--tRNA ligase [Bacteroidales bacterium]